MKIVIGINLMNALVTSDYNELVKDLGKMPATCALTFPEGLCIDVIITIE